MSKVMFTNNFSKSLAALLREYNNAPIHLSDKSMAEYLNNFIENGSYICENIHNDYTVVPMHLFHLWLWTLILEITKAWTSAANIYQTVWLGNIYLTYIKQNRANC